MTKVDLDFKKVNLGHVLTIISILSAAFVGFSTFENRITRVETNVEWLVKFTAERYQVNPPTSNK